jgi:hypothetical protein
MELKVEVKTAKTRWIEKMVDGRGNQWGYHGARGVGRVLGSRAEAAAGAGPVSV